VPFIHPRHGPGVRLRGRELIQFIHLVTGAPSGTTLANWDVSPSNLLGTRAAALAALYEKYRFKVMQFEWSPECGSDATGKVLLAYDPDCLDATPPVSFAGIKAASSFAGSKDSTIWKPCAIRVVEKEDQLFFTNEVPNTDARLIYQGQFYLMNGGASTIATTDGIGTLSLAFELEFYKPALEQIGSSLDLQFNVPSLNLRTTAYTNPKQMFNLLGFSGISSLTRKVAGGIQQLVDAVGNTFYRVPPGVYRANLLTQESGFPVDVTQLSSLSAPTISAVLGPNAPAGAAAPSVVNLNTPLFSLPANAVAAAFASGIQAITEGDYMLNAPSGADVYGNMGAAVNWSPFALPANVGWEFDRVFGAQAISP